MKRIRQININEVDDITYVFIDSDEEFSSREFKRDSVTSIYLRNIDRVIQLQLEESENE